MTTVYRTSAIVGKDEDLSWDNLSSHNDFEPGAQAKHRGLYKNNPTPSKLL